MTKVFFSPVPMLTACRLLRRRSSTILPPWMTPIRRTLPWVAMCLLERLLLDRLLDLGEEGLRAIQVRVIQVRPRHQEDGLRLLDPALDPHLLEAQDLLRRLRTSALVGLCLCDGSDDR